MIAIEISESCSQPQATAKFIPTTYVLHCFDGELIEFEGELLNILLLATNGGQ